MSLHYSRTCFFLSFFFYSVGQYSISDVNRIIRGLFSVQCEQELTLICFYNADFSKIKTKRCKLVKMSAGSVEITVHSVGQLLILPGIEVRDSSY